MSRSTTADAPFLHAVGRSKSASAAIPRRLDASAASSSSSLTTSPPSTPMPHASSSSSHSSAAGSGCSAVCESAASEPFASRSARSFATRTRPARPRDTRCTCVAACSRLRCSAATARSLPDGAARRAADTGRLERATVFGARAERDLRRTRRFRGPAAGAVPTLPPPMSAAARRGDVTDAGSGSKLLRRPRPRAAGWGSPYAAYTSGATFVRGVEGRLPGRDRERERDCDRRPRRARTRDRGPARVGAPPPPTSPADIKGSGDAAGSRARILYALEGRATRRPRPLSAPLAAASGGGDGRKSTRSSDF